MKFDIKTIGLVVLIAIFSIFFTLRNNYVLEIDRLNHQLDEIKRQNDTLYSRLELVSKTYDEVKPKKITSRKSRAETSTEKNHVVEIEKPISGMQKFEKVMDSIKSTLPNRTGQDLINSLKIKTEI